MIRVQHAWDSHFWKLCNSIIEEVAIDLDMYIVYGAEMDIGFWMEAF